MFMTPFMSPFISPFSFMRRFGEGMEQLFNDFGSSGMMQRGMGELADWAPQIEVFQREGQLVIRADLPGLNKDDVRVEVRDDAVIIQGERQEEHKEEREGVYTTERTYGRFYREIPLPDGVDADRATANFRAGVLEIAMPAEQSQVRGRQLEIQEQRSGEQHQGRQQARAAGAGR
jgi:HSP20 family protein